MAFTQMYISKTGEAYVAESWRKHPSEGGRAPELIKDTSKMDILKRVGFKCAGYQSDSNGLLVWEFGSVSFYKFAGVDRGVDEGSALQVVGDLSDIHAAIGQLLVDQKKNELRIRRLEEWATGGQVSNLDRMDGE